MQHRRFYVERLTASGRALPSRGGDLVVARRSESPQIDWELIHRTAEQVSIDQAPYHLEIACPDRDFSGDALLVRSDGLSHVFRGAGALSGFVEADFDD